MERFKSLDNFSSRQKWKDYLWQELTRKFSELKSVRQTEIFLNKLLTKKEKDVLIKRLMIMVLIQKGKSYSEMSEMLWLSPNTISAIKNGLKNSEYKSYFEILKNKKINNKTIDKKQEKLFSAESFGEFLEAIGKFTDDSGIIPPIGRHRWKYFNHK
ncbi:MAG: Trp family transcriptional regulator [Patescibacteria group bacterium]